MCHHKTFPNEAAILPESPTAWRCQQKSHAALWCSTRGRWCPDDDTRSHSEHGLKSEHQRWSVKSFFFLNHYLNSCTTFYLHVWVIHNKNKTIVGMIHYIYVSKLKEIPTYIRYENGKIVTIQHLLQLCVCGHFIHWTRDKLDSLSDFQLIVKCVQVSPCLKIREKEQIVCFVKCFCKWTNWRLWSVQPRQRQHEITYINGCSPLDGVILHLCSTALSLSLNHNQFKYTADLDHHLCEAKRYFVTIKVK